MHFILGLMFIKLNILVKKGFKELCLWLVNYFLKVNIHNSVYFSITWTNKQAQQLPLKATRKYKRQYKHETNQ